MTCFICRKHAGEIAPPPGGYIIKNEHWHVCHAPAHLGPLGTILIESTRHILDFSQMSPAEAASYGPLLRAVYQALYPLTGAERVYQLMTLEGEAHFHVWLVPRRPEDDARGLKFLAGEHTCEKEAAQAIAETIRENLRTK